jgi:hypothetical protein
MSEKMAKKKTEVIENVAVAVTYSKQQILGSNKYKNRRDVLGAILTDGKEYTIEEVDSLLDKFMKGKVN